MRKFTVPVVIMLAVSAFLAVVVIPDLMNAWNRSRQKRTMADLRTIAIAWEAYAEDRRVYNVDAYRGPNDLKDASHFTALHRIRESDLRRALVPKYVKELPMVDGWGRAIEVGTGDYDANGHARLYAMRSAGSDGRMESSPYTLGTTSSFQDDIVLELGNFVRYPEGI